MPRGDENQALQLHYLYGLRAIKQGWTPAQKTQLAESAGANTVKHQLHAFALFSALLIASVSAQQPPGGGRGMMPALLSVNFDDHAGFTSIFDGRSTAGWEGAPEVSSVIEGVSARDFAAGCVVIVPVLRGPYHPRIR
jgi:hypothetical protein